MECHVRWTSSAVPTNSAALTASRNVTIEMTAVTTAMKRTAVSIVWNPADTSVPICLSMQINLINFKH
jgi:hypothetical protein